MWIKSCLCAKCISSLSAWLLANISLSLSQQQDATEFASSSANKYHSGLLQSAARSVEQSIPAGIHICLGRMFVTL